MLITAIAEKLLQIRTEKSFLILIFKIFVLSGTNIRGLAPHYATLQTYETQMKMAKIHDEGSEFLPNKDFFATCEEVILNPGDVFFHPAGAWHSVEALSDSLSINFSLLNLSWADVIGPAIQQLLYKDEGMRQKIVGCHDHATLLSTMKEKVEAVSKMIVEQEKLPEQICPPILLGECLLITQESRFCITETFSIFGFTCAEHISKLFSHEASEQFPGARKHAPPEIAPRR